MLKILGLAALMTLFVGTAPKAMANDEEAAMAPAMEELMTAEDPTAAPPRWRPAPRGRFVCYARNATGRTFAAWGTFRTPARWVQQRALEQCRRSSGFFRFTCRNIGCRRVGWR